MILITGAGGSGPGDRGPSGVPPGSSTPQGGDSTQDKKSPAVSQWWQRTRTPKPGGSSFETGNDEATKSGADADPNVNEAPAQHQQEPKNDTEPEVTGLSRAYVHWLQLHQQLQQELARFYFGYGMGLSPQGGPQDLSKKSKRWFPARWKH